MTHDGGVGRVAVGRGRVDSAHNRPSAEITCSNTCSGKQLRAATVTYGYITDEKLAGNLRVSRPSRLLALCMWQCAVRTLEVLQAARYVPRNGLRGT